MRHIIPYVDNSQSFGISNPNYIELIINEAEVLNRAESMIPSDMLFELELNLLLEQGFKAVDKYHRNLVKGTNTLFNSASKLISKDEFTKIEESFKTIIEELKSSKVNEDEAIPVSADTAQSGVSDLDWQNVGDVIGSSGVTGAGEGDNEGMLGMLKGLMSSLTEGGSPIGILHFILDIVGLVGDVFGPVGMIADIINGLIYMFRAVYYKDSSKWILALISFAAAVIPFAGNIMKGMFQASKTGKAVVHVSTSYMDSAGKVAVGGAKVSDEAVTLLSKAGPKSVDALQYISKTTHKSLPLVKQIIDKFFKDFLGTVVGWVPFLGKPLKKFFASIADMFDIFFKKSTKFADDVPEIIEKVHLKQIDDFFKASSGKGTQIVADGQDLLIKNARGALIKNARGETVKLNASILKGSDFLPSRYGPDLADAIGQKYITRTQNNVASFYKGLGDNLQQIAPKYGKVLRVGKSAFTFSRKLAFFIGRQVVKLAMGVNGKALSDGEIEAIGTISINQAMQNKINRNLKENPDAAYDVPIYDAIKDKDAYEVINGTLQKQAKMFNMPEIGIVAYAQHRRKDNIPQDVKDYWNFAYGDQEAEADRAERSLTPDSKVEESLKHIKKFKL